MLHTTRNDEETASNVIMVNKTIMFGAIPLKEKIQMDSNYEDIVLENNTRNFSYRTITDNFQCLKVGNFMNDEVISIILDIMQTQSTSQRCLLLNTYVLNKARGDVCFSSWIHKWIKKHQNKFGYKPEDIEKIFFPVNIGNYHWVAGVVDVKRKVIIYYDPLHKDLDSSSLSRNTRGASSHMLELTHLEDLYNLVSYLFCNRSYKKFHDEWNLEYELDIHVPRQHDSYNCGIYILLYAYHIQKNGAFTRDQENFLSSKQGADQLRKELLHLIVINSGNDPNSATDILTNLNQQLKKKTNRKKTKKSKK